MDTARISALTIMCMLIAFAVMVAMFVWGRSSVVDDCERYGKFYDGKRSFECAPFANPDLGGSK